MRLDKVTRKRRRTERFVSFLLFIATFVAVTSIVRFLPHHVVMLVTAFLWGYVFAWWRGLRALRRAALRDIERWKKCNEELRELRLRDGNDPRRSR